jgi:nucleotide-binding universal stress UspA family protein
MKKIIAAIDGLKYSKSTRDYAIELAKMNNAHLVGVFLDDFSYTSYKIYDLISEKGGLIGAARKKFDKKDAKIRAIARDNFEAACQKAGLEYTVHRDRSIAIQELLHESIYADLIIIDVRETLTHYTEKVPTDFVRDLLTQAQCPVLIVPPLYKPIEKVTFLYDGEPSSVHAIKMLSYILPQLKEKTTEVLCVNSSKSTLHVPDNKLMKELMKRHFPDPTFTVLKGNAESEIIDYLKKQEDISLVVLGAYCRGRLSRWLKESLADVMMKEIKLPLFIAHNK